MPRQHSTDMTENTELLNFNNIINMKKILFAMAIALVAMTGCKKKTTEEPQTETQRKTINYLLGQYVGPLTEQAGAAEYLQFLFTEGEVGYIPQTGSAYGTGNIYRITIFAKSVDANMFPNNGKYIGNDSFEPNTFYCTTSSSANGYTTILKLKDGAIESDTRIVEGTITITGDSKNGEFVFELKDKQGETHQLYYKGAAPVEAVE